MPGMHGLERTDSQRVARVCKRLNKFVPVSIGGQDDSSFT